MEESYGQNSSEIFLYWNVELEMISKNLSETMSRTVKMALDSGEASTLEEAETIFYKYQLIIEIGSSVATSPTLQAALLTAVNAGRRAFLGGVSVCGCLDFNLLIPWKESGLS